MHEAYFGGCPVGLTREHCLTHGGGVVQGWPQSALDSLVVWGREDFMGEWFPYPTRLHTDELGVRTVGLSHKEIEDSLKSEASCCLRLQLFCLQPAWMTRRDEMARSVDDSRAVLACNHHSELPRDAAQGCLEN